MSKTKIILNNGLTLFDEVVANVEVTVDPASIADGDSATLEVDAPGAAFGDYVLVAPPYDLQDLNLGAPYVSAAGKVSIPLLNNTGGAVDLGEGDWKVKVIR